MRVLDSCLKILEDACESGTATVSNEISERVRLHVEEVKVGMPVSEAMEAVFGRQQTLLIRSPGAADGNARQTEQLETQQKPLGNLLNRSSSSTNGLVLMTVDQAKSLTEQIRGGVRNLSVLLIEAHRGRAWQALGYESWGAYVRHELGLSRSRSYELLDHARVLLAVKVAARLSAYPELSAYEAQRMKGDLSRIERELRHRTRGVSEVEARGIVRNIAKTSTLRRKPRTPVATSFTDLSTERSLDFDVGRLIRAIDLIATLPLPPVVATQLSSEDWRRLGQVSLASSWLAGFSREWADWNERDYEGPPNHLNAISV